MPQITWSESEKLYDFEIETFNIKCTKTISNYTKTILQILKGKGYYYVIDDLLYHLKSHKKECDYLLQILHSTVIYLQNNKGINFFEIFIYEIYINEAKNSNKFDRNQNKSFKNLNVLTIKLAYQKIPFIEPVEVVW